MIINLNDQPPYKDPALSIELRVEDLLKRMTLEEKIDQMSIYRNDIIGYLSNVFPFLIFLLGNDRQTMFINLD